MNFVPVSKIISFCILNFCVMFVQGAEVEIPYTFKDGQVTSAEKMNANFDAIKRAINELNGDGISFASTKFIGFSKGRVIGSDGLFALQKECRKLSSESHVCSAQELTRSKFDADVESKLISGEQAWVRGSLTLIGFKFDSKVSTSVADALNCKGWQDEAADGLVVDAKGKFKMLDCKKKARVACCE